MGCLSLLAACALLMVTSGGLSGHSDLIGCCLKQLGRKDTIKYAFLTKKSCIRSLDILLDTKEAVLVGALAMT